MEGREGGGGVREEGRGGSPKLYLPQLCPPPFQQGLPQTPFWVAQPLPQGSCNLPTGKRGDSTLPEAQKQQETPPWSPLLPIHRTKKIPFFTEGQPGLLIGADLRRGFIKWGRGNPGETRGHGILRGKPKWGRAKGGGKGAAMK